MADRGTESTLVQGEPGSIGAMVEALAARLAAAGVETPKREARDMISSLLDVPRFWTTLHAEDRPTAELLEVTTEAVSRREAGAPFAYAVRRAPFRHFMLEVDERVLIPRPETELLPEMVIHLLRHGGGTAIDVGTGSGAIALALAAEGRFDRVIATDISQDALDVARANAERLRDALRAPVEFRLGAGMAPVCEERAMAVVSNPPYVAYDELEALPSEVRDWEPAWALSCGQDGLSVTAGIVRDAAGVLEPGGLLALEVDVRRAAQVAELVTSHGAYTGVRIEMDLTGRERFVVARREG